jgi:uncharacterized membrane protein YczE
METSAIQSLKLVIVHSVGLSKDALHVYVGLVVFFVACGLLRKRKGLATPLLVVVLVAVAGEMLDLRDDLGSLGHWRWAASVHDIVNTVFWPAVMAGLARLGVSPWQGRG